MKTSTLCLIAALATVSTFSVAVTPLEAGTSQCWSWYNHAWAQMQAGNHRGYDNAMRKYNRCMNQAWEGPVPEEKEAPHVDSCSRGRRLRFQKASASADALLLWFMRGRGHTKQWEMKMPCNYCSTGHRLVSTLFALFLFSDSLLAQGIEHPKQGSSFRAELLDAARPVFVAETDGPIEFVVQRLAVAGAWAFGDVKLQRPGGHPVDWHRTKFADALRQDMFNSENSFFLLRKSNDRWSVVEFVVGPTDVTWDWWRQQYNLPQTLFTD